MDMRHNVMRLRLSVALTLALWGICGAVTTARGGGIAYTWRSGSNANWSASGAWGQVSGYPGNVDDAALYYSNASATTTQNVAGAIIGTFNDAANGAGPWTIQNNSSSNALTFQVSSGNAVLQSCNGANVYIYPDIVLKSPVSMIASNPGGSLTFGINLYGKLTGTGDVVATAYGSSTANHGATLSLNSLNNSGGVTINAITNSTGPATVTITTIGASVTNLTKIGNYGYVTVGGGSVACPINGDNSQNISKNTISTLAMSADNSTTFSGRWIFASASAASGVLQFNSTNSFGVMSASNVTLGAGNIVVAGCPIDQGFVNRIYPSGAGVIALGTNSSCSSLLCSNVYLGSVGTNTFSGTLTLPANDVYYLGGGGGTLILSAANALTGTVSTQIIEIGVEGSFNNGGGEIVMLNSNAFTGSIRFNQGYTLTTPYLANIGTPSGIGSGAELDLDGGTLKYTGTGASINYGITLYHGTMSTIDASGSGPLKFTSTAVDSIKQSAGARGVILAGTNANDNTFGIKLVDDGAYPVSVVKAGPGNWIMTNTNTYSGATTISGGVLQVNGLLTTSAVVVAGGTLAGTGTISSNIAVASGATLAPGVPGSNGVLTAGAVALATNAICAIALNGSVAGANYNQLQASGPVSLGGATLALSLGFKPASGSAFPIIRNTGGAIPDTFGSVPRTVTYGGVTYSVSVDYAGGAGHDVVVRLQGSNGTAILFR